MAKLTDILAETGKAAIQTAGGSFGVVYREWWETQFSEQDWEGFKALSARDYFKAVLPRMLESWELVDANEQPIPITAEAIEEHQMPTRLLSLIERAVGEATKLGKASGSNSAAT